jgi:hypothetical protein
MMIVDSRILHVYGFNFTGLDIEKSRSFGVISKNGKKGGEESGKGGEEGGPGGGCRLVKAVTGSRPKIPA